MNIGKVEFGAISPQDIIIGKNELAQRLQCPGELAFSQAEPFLERFFACIDCRYTGRYTKIKRIDACTLDLGFGEIKSSRLASFLKSSETAAVFAVTLGHGIDRELSRLSLSPAEAFIFDALASAAAEAAADKVQQLLTEKAAPYRRFSPGYGDLELFCQKPLLEFLDAGRLLGITLSDSLLMSPSKTITAIVRIEE